MKIAYMMFARNKAPWVADTVRSMLAQTMPCDIYLSDQGSTDGTYEVMSDAVAPFQGRHNVTLLKCPETSRRGRAGLIQHINWLHENVKADYYITTAADDIDHQDRVLKTAEAIRRLPKTPLFFGTAQHFCKADLSIYGETAYPRESKWIGVEEHLGQLVGGSCSGAWSRELVDTFGPLPETALVDVYMPFCAALMGGFYFLNEHLHSYVWRKDVDNTGLQGRSDNAKSRSEQERIRELVQCEFVGNVHLMIRVAVGLYEHKPTPALDETLQYLYRTLMAQSGGWFDARMDLIRQGIRPGRMPY